MNRGLGGEVGSGPGSGWGEQSKQQQHHNEQIVITMNQKKTMTIDDLPKFLSLGLYGVVKRPIEYSSASFRDQLGLAPPPQANF